MELMEKDRNFYEQERLDRATKRVKQIKGFYSHLLVYIVINIAIFIVNYNSFGNSGGFLKWQNFSTPIFWGIGLLAHGLSVFVPGMIMGKDWEERKIKELMDKNKKRWE